MDDIERCRREQAECCDYILQSKGTDTEGAWRGLGDWFGEEIFLSYGKFTSNGIDLGAERTYQDFLDSKHVRVAFSGFDAGPVNPMLFAWQKEIVEWAVKRGKAAIFSECGTGKTPMQAEWARIVEDHTSKPVLILTPLAVAAQTVREGRKFGIPITYVRGQSDVGPRGLYVTNYDMLKAFDPADFGGVVLDESSILKAYTGATKRAILAAFKDTPYKLACTATPAPNDHLELGNHSQFLDVLDSNEMISRWFVNDTMKAGGYRLKKHAAKDYWRWVAGWSVCFEKPSDLGHSDEGFIIPPLQIHEHVVNVDCTQDAGDMLIRASKLSSTSLHREMRLTAGARAARTAELVNPSSDPWVIWCNTDYEADALNEVIESAIEVRGSEPNSRKEEKLEAFGQGREFRIITKPKIAAFGLNWQHCHDMAFVGLSYSYEQLYQAIRRSWRYGQKYPVNAHIIMADTEGPVLKTIQRKQRQHLEMKAEMVSAMKEVQLEMRAPLGLRVFARPDVEIPNWLGVKA